MGGEKKCPFGHKKILCNLSIARVKKKIKNHLASTHTHTEKKILRVARTDPKTHHAANCVKNLEICRLAARKYREIHQMVDGNITKNNTGKYHKILNKTVLNVFF